MFKPGNNAAVVKVVITSILLIFLPATTLKGQSYNVSEISGRFVKDSDFDSLIRFTVLPIAQKYTITRAEVGKRYENNRQYYIQRLRPLLQQRFAVLDRTFEHIPAITGSATYNRARHSYLAYTQQVLQTVLGGTNILSPLIAMDFNDRILKFHTDITVMPDGKMEVTEFITVFNGNGQPVLQNPGSSATNSNDDIKRGIVRDLPTRYMDKNGFWSIRGFRLKGAFKNGKAEPYSEELMPNGVSIRLGKKEVNLPEGVFEYRLDYETDGQILFHPNKDELYWNVNGNGWVFTADTVSCHITFPKGGQVKEYACYTGIRGSTSSDCKARIPDDGSILFATSNRLEAYEGLTVAAAIQKGIIVAPGRLLDAVAFIKANYMLVALACLLVFLFCFYYVIWYRKGRDPVGALIYPRFAPPPGLSPADMGYIFDQRYNPHLFTATIVDFAVRKYLDIEVKQEGRSGKTSYYYLKQPAGSAIVPDTTNSYGFNVDRLYGQSVKRGVYNATLKSCNDALKARLKERFLIRKGKTNVLFGAFRLNKGYTRFGGILVLIGLLGSFFFMADHPPSRTLFRLMALLMIALIIVQIVFVRIMRAYSEEGRTVADHILGFKMYLEQSEQEIFAQFTPTEKSLDLFEKFLPYAIALKVGNEWSAKFDSIMQGAMNEGYRPSYYIVGQSVFSMHTMASDISAGLSGSIASASTPPGGSSGGSGGGGSSGGGGGGGGGGGW